MKKTSKLLKILSLTLSVLLVYVSTLGSIAYAVDSKDRVMLDNVVIAVDRDGKVTVYDSDSPRPYEEQALLGILDDVSTTAITFWDIGYDSSTNLHTYEVAFSSRLLDDDGYYFDSSTLEITPLNLKALSNTIRYSADGSRRRIASDSISYVYAGGQTPSKPTVKATVTLSVHGLGTYKLPTKTLSSPKTPGIG